MTPLIAAILALIIGLALVLRGRMYRTSRGLGQGRTVALDNRDALFPPLWPCRQAGPDHRGEYPRGVEELAGGPRLAPGADGRLLHPAGGGDGRQAAARVHRDGGRDPAHDREHGRAEGLGSGRGRSDSGGTGEGRAVDPGQPAAGEVPDMRAAGELRAEESVEGCDSARARLCGGPRDANAQRYCGRRTWSIRHPFSQK